jgi:hypothetical protein
MIHNEEPHTQVLSLTARQVEGVSEFNASLAVTFKLTAREVSSSYPGPCLKGVKIYWQPIIPIIPLDKSQRALWHGVRWKKIMSGRS